MLLYSFFLSIALLLGLPYFIIKMITDKKYYEGLPGRFGFFPKDTINKLKSISEKKIWIHSVSVGEFLIALPIIKKIQNYSPQTHIILTTTTKTSQNLAKTKLQKNITILYSPLDFGIIVNKFIKIIKPSLLIIMETEIWPNLIYKTNKKNIPIILLNGRISDKSYKGYKRFKHFIGIILKKITTISVRAEEDKNKFSNLFANNSQLAITGNIKYDVQPETIISKSELQTTLNIPYNKKIFIAGSTHEKEEEYILETYKFIKKIIPDLVLIIAPRHPERIKKIENLLDFHKLSYIKKSQIDQLKDKKNYPILLIDTIGDLFSLYNLADLVFIGGSMIPHGGQNILEPAYFSKPIIFGQYMSNFKDIAEIFIKQKAGIMVKDQTELTNAAHQILNNPELARSLGENAKAILHQNQGALEKNFEIIRQYL